MHASLKRPVRLALVSAMLVGIGAHAAAAEPFLSATSSLSNLTFQLIDLNPNDGIAPSFTLIRDGIVNRTPLDVPSGGSWLEPLVTSAPLTGTTAGSPFPTFTQNTPEGSLKITPNSLSLNNSVRIDDVIAHSKQNTASYTQGALLYTETQTEQLVGAGSEQAFQLVGQEYTYDPDLGYLSTFNGKLSANTALIVTGQASMNLHVDRGVLEAQADELALSNDFSDFNGIVRASLDIGLSGNSQTTGGPGGAYANFSNAFSLGEDVALARGLTSRYDVATGTYIESQDPILDLNPTRTFSLMAFNNGDTATDIAFDLTMNATVAEVVYGGKTTTVITDNPDWVPEPPTPTIPEPSTYALMGLGLVGIALARRRLRPTQKV